MPLSEIVAVADLQVGEPYDVTIQPDQESHAKIAEFLGIIAVSKSRLTARLMMHRDGSVDLSGKLGATVTQPCVVSFRPVRTRIEETVERRYVPELPEPDEDHQMAEDEDVFEPLGKSIDLGVVLVEDLALAVPSFPRAADAELTTQNFTAPGQTPMTDQDAKPFAALAALRDKMQDPE